MTTTSTLAEALRAAASLVLDAPDARYVTVLQHLDGGHAITIHCTTDEQASALAPVLRDTVVRRADHDGSAWLSVEGTHWGIPTTVSGPHRDAEVAA